MYARLRHSRSYVRVGEHMVRHKWLLTSGCTVGLVIPISISPNNARRHFVIRSSAWRELWRLILALLEYAVLGIDYIH